MLARLEEIAAALGASRIILETGRPQPEAIGLYESSGYQPIPGYGYYRSAPLSVCYGKPVSHIRAS
jgi:GNAT superfamily N-acetyltransferase